MTQASAANKQLLLQTSNFLKWLHHQNFDTFNGDVATSTPLCSRGGPSFSPDSFEEYLQPLSRLPLLGCPQVGKGKRFPMLPTVDHTAATVISAEDEVFFPLRRQWSRPKGVAQLSNETPSPASSFSPSRTASSHGQVTRWAMPLPFKRPCCASPH
eukprot:GGOE01003464.1.p1 GENE.GGOE01003464.1~~GGOE01003464.1.p1  ORF type:complete len:156 (-),score=8.45 GGOE01003464.1:398-865(-)